MASEAVSIEVGQPWPGELIEGDSATWYPDSGLVLLVAGGITEKERAGFTAPIDVAVWASGPIVGLMVRLDGWAWSDLPGWCRWEQIPEGLSGELTATTRQMVHIVVVEGRDKTVQLSRLISLSPHMTKVLHREVKDRWTQVLPDDQAFSIVRAWQDAHATDRARVQATLARGKGGD